MKQTLGRQVVSTLPVKHILLLQHLHEPPSPVSIARPIYCYAYVAHIRPHQSWSRVCGPAVPVALAKTAATDHAIRKCAFSPNCWGTGGGLRGGVEMGTYWRPTYSTKPTRKPQSTMCSFWDLRRYSIAVVAVAAAVAGRGKLKNVK